MSSWEKNPEKGLMAASDAQPSFLCLLPELQGKPTSVLYLNGTSENSSIRHFSTAPIPLTITRRKCQNGAHDLPIRTPNAITYIGLSNGYCNNRETVLSNGDCSNRESTFGNSFHRVVSYVRSTATSMEANSNEHEPPDKAMRGDTCIADKGESGSTGVAESEENHDLIRDFMEEEDELAFEISEFFKAFEDGQEHTLMILREKLRSSSTESVSKQKVGEKGSISKHILMDGQSNSYELGILRDREFNDGISGNMGSPGQSGKWNGDLEVDSVLANLSGPLPFLGPNFYSGHSGHIPYSGSLSYRSDSSTASTHSFAFPILPCEWNSSPVKMAQPDQRYTRQRWKQRLHGFFCCNSSTTVSD